jgi:6-phosphogluconolactonase
MKLLHTEERSAADLPAALAQDIAARLQAAIDARGQAVLTVSGGKSPIALFQALRVLPLAWHQVTVTLADERCVANTHADSNALLVRSHLLKDQSSSSTFGADDCRRLAFEHTCPDGCASHDKLARLG